jgi:hypothetical protein
MRGDLIIEEVSSGIYRDKLSMVSSTVFWELPISSLREGEGTGWYMRESMLA